MSSHPDGGWRNHMEVAYSYCYELLISVVRHSVKVGWHSFNPKFFYSETLCMPSASVDRTLKRMSSKLPTVLYPRARSNEEFYLHHFGLQVLLNMNAQSCCRRALKSAHEQEDRRQCRNERVRHAVETAEQSRARLRNGERKGTMRDTLLRPLVKDKLLPWTKWHACYILVACILLDVSGTRTIHVTYMKHACS